MSSAVERHALRRQVVRLDEVADRLAEAGAEAVLVRAARAGRDAVDVAADVLVGRLGPLQRELDAGRRCRRARARTAPRARRARRARRPACAGSRRCRRRARRSSRSPRDLVDERDLERRGAGSSRPRAARACSAASNSMRREDRRVGVEEDRRAGAARRADLLDRSPCGSPCRKRCSHCRAVAPDGGDQLLRQRVDDAGADAVQAAGGLVVAVLELAAGVEHREDHLERALAGLRVLVDRDAAAVVGDGERRCRPRAA